MASSRRDKYSSRKLARKNRARKITQAELDKLPRCPNACQSLYRDDRFCPSCGEPVIRPYC